MIINNKKIIIGREEVKNENQDTSRKWYINQCGYDINKSKRATFTNSIRGTKFYVKNSNDNTVVYEGTIYNQIADFSKFNISGEYYLECIGIKSYNFKIGKNYLQNLSIPIALDFMEQSRQDLFDSSGMTGFGWRDGHQFSFELNSLVMMYMANPSYYESLPRDVYKVSECEYEELRTQTEPNIIWLIKFGVTRYYKWATENEVQLHAFIKGQLAYFLFLYPHITQYVTREFYETIRDFTISIWGNTTCNKSWFDEISNQSLFATQSVVGSVKGASPPGYAIMPNLLMWEVLKRDGLQNAENYFNSAYNNAKWLIDIVDLDNPASTKGQRMSEYITMTSLCYFYEKYPNLCPPNTYKKIERFADIMISRSNNLWDFRQFRTKDDLSGSTYTTWVNDYTGSGGLGNQPGNVAGFMSIAYAVARVIKDESKKKRLKILAISHLDHTYGRNPMGRHLCFRATSEFEGAELGWSSNLHGIGNIDWCVGALDGSPKENSYPYNPTASEGYSEGWVAFNTAWNTSLAYLCGEDKSINGLDIFSNI